jgi:hypothetical protein
MKILLIILCILIAIPNVFSQILDPTAPRPLPGRVRPQTDEEKRKENLDIRREQMRILNSRERNLPISENKRLSGKELKRIKSIKKASKEDEAIYKSFLKQSNTGIFRLLPNFGCETENIIRVDGDCENFIPGVWTYSFRSKDYSDRTLHDLSFKENYLITDGLLSQGILVSFGNKMIDSISLESAELNFLTNFKPETELQAINRQYQKLSAGVEQNGFVYTNKLKMEENTTYALRVIAYDYKDEWKSRLWERNISKASDEERKFVSIDYDKRNDSIYIFRVIRKADDGGITIIWKRLSKEESPKITYKEDEKLRDFKSGK